MRIKLLIPLLFCLIGCTIGPDYPLEREGTWEHYAIGGSMGDAYHTVMMEYDWAGVEVGKVCAYVWKGRVILHRVNGKIGGGWTMRGDLNMFNDEGIMTRGNYVGTVME